MSRFTKGFINQDSDSDSEENDSSEQEDYQQNIAATAGKRVKGYGQSSSDDESDGERVMKSGNQKLQDALTKALGDVRSAINNGDFNKMDENFESLTQEITKSRDKFFKENGDKLPSSVLKVLE